MTALMAGVVARAAAWATRLLLGGMRGAVIVAGVIVARDRSGLVTLRRAGERVHCRGHSLQRNGHQEREERVASEAGEHGAECTDRIESNQVKDRRILILFLRKANRGGAG